MSPLLASLLDAQLTPELRVQFNQMLRDPQHRDHYLRLIRLHAMLKWRFDSTLQFDRVAAPSVQHSFAARRGLSPALLRYALAAVIVLGFAGLAGLLLSRSVPRQGVATAAPVATLIDSSDAVWADTSSASGGVRPVPGQQLRPGFVRLESGRAVIEFFSGAQVTLNGPCEFGLNSAMRGFLRHGELTAFCPRQARGFTVGAPGAAIVDLGTRFHLAVDGEGRSSVRVLEGHVEVQHAHGKPIALNAHQARSFDADGRLTATDDDVAPPPPVSALYDFSKLKANPYPGVHLAGQDGWVSIAGAGATVRSDALLSGGHWAFFPSNSGFECLRRDNGGAFAYTIASGSTFTLEYNLRLGPAGRGARVGLTDADGRTLFEFGNSGPGDKPSAWTFRDKHNTDTRSLDRMPTQDDARYHLVATVDPGRVRRHRGVQPRRRTPWRDARPRRRPAKRPHEPRARRRHSHVRLVPERLRRQRRGRHPHHRLTRHPRPSQPLAPTLIAILLPSLGQAREQARRVVSLTHQKQIGIDILSYASNNAGFTPLFYGWTPYCVTTNQPGNVSDARPLLLQNRAHDVLAHNPAAVPGAGVRRL